jgi:hypothetical protein
MAFKTKHFDPQIAEYDHVMEEVNRAIDELEIDSDAVNYWFENAPESHVFYQSDLDEAYGGDFDEARETVMAVGGRDLDSKIRYWRRILSDITNGDY